MNKSERVENRKKCVTSGTTMAIIGILMLVIIVPLRLFSVPEVVITFLSITSILFIITGAVYPTIFVILRNRYLRKHDLYK